MAMGVSAKEYPSLPSKVLSEYVPAKVDASAKNRAAAGKAFLASLDEKLKAQAALKMDSDERQKWTNVPPRGPQGGVRFGDLNEAQMKKAMKLLSAVLSEQGYAKVRNIPLADDRLLRNGKRRPGFGAEDFWLAIFGTPSETEPWAIQVDGHHLALNLTMNGEKMSLSPSFIGTQPRMFLLGDKKVEVIQPKADLGHELAMSLTDEQKKKAVISKKRGRIQTAAGKDGIIPKLDGISCALLDAKQKKILIELMRAYVADLPEPAKTARMKELEKEIPNMHYSWKGPAPKGSDMSYKLQGPSVIIEYACQSLGGDPLNHVHSMYRNPKNEYGVGIVK